MSDSTTTNRKSISVAFLISFFAILSTISAQTIFTVTSSADSGAGTLRQALLDANALPASLDETVAYIDLTFLQETTAPAQVQISLNLGAIPISRSVHIFGTNGFPLPRITSTNYSSFALLGLTKPIEVSLQYLRFEGGRSTGTRGVLNCEPGTNVLNLQIEQCEFVDNQITPDPLNFPSTSGFGGAIFFESKRSAAGTLKLKNCLFENNQALSNQPEYSSSEGSAVYLRNTHVEVENCRFLNNVCTTKSTAAGAALMIKSSPSEAKVKSCVFIGNLGGNNGLGGAGGISCHGDSTYTSSPILLEDSFFEGGSGTSVRLQSGTKKSTSTATIRNVTFTGNYSHFSPAVGVSANYGTINLTHCTIWKNSHGSFRDSAVHVIGPGNQLVVSRCVIAENFHRDNYQAEDVSPDISVATGSVEDLLLSAGYNFIGDSAGLEDLSSGPGDRVGTRAVPLIPRLANRGDYGGQTPSCPPLPDSPLVDFIPNAANVLLTDQRGVDRPQGFTADIGAVELPRLSYDVWDDQIPLAADRGALKDPDNDGLENRLEYFFGTDPMLQNAAPVRIVEKDGVRFFEVTRSATVRPAFFTRTDAESSVDLAPGSWSTLDSTFSSPENEGYLERIRMLYPTGNVPRRFFRVAVEN